MDAIKVSFVDSMHKIYIKKRGSERQAAFALHPVRARPGREVCGGQARRWTSKVGYGGQLLSEYVLVILPKDKAKKN